MPLGQPTFNLSEFGGLQPVCYDGEPAYLNPDVDECGNAGTATLLTVNETNGELEEITGVVWDNVSYGPCAPTVTETAVCAEPPSIHAEGDITGIVASGSGVYDPAVGGTVYTRTGGNEQTRLTQRLPYDSRIAYEVSITVTQTVNDPADLSRFYMGFDSFDDAGQLTTDSANTYNYGVAAGVQIPQGDKVTYTTTISGYNDPAPAVADRSKADPYATGIELLMLTNFGGVNGNGNEIVVHSITVEPVPGTYEQTPTTLVTTYDEAGVVVGQEFRQGGEVVAEPESWSDGPCRCACDQPVDPVDQVDVEYFCNDDTGFWDRYTTVTAAGEPPTVTVTATTVPCGEAQPGFEQASECRNGSVHVVTTEFVDGEPPAEVSAVDTGEPCGVTCALATLWRVTGGTPGVNEEHWDAEGGAAPHGMTGGIWDGWHDHVNGAPDGVVVVPDWTENDSQGTNTGVDQSLYWGWVYLPEAAYVKDVNTNYGEYMSAWVGENCCPAELVAARTTETVSGDEGIDVGWLPAGLHFLALQISDLSSFAGVQLQYAADGETFVNFPASQSFATKPDVSCVPVWVCDDQTIKDLDGAAVAKDPLFDSWCEIATGCDTPGDTGGAAVPVAGCVAGSTPLDITDGDTYVAGDCAAPTWAELVDCLETVGCVVTDTVGQVVVTGTVPEDVPAATTGPVVLPGVELSYTGTGDIGSTTVSGGWYHRVLANGATPGVMTMTFDTPVSDLSTTVFDLENQETVDIVAKIGGVVVPFDPAWVVHPGTITDNGGGSYSGGTFSGGQDIDPARAMTLDIPGPIDELVFSLVQTSPTGRNILFDAFTFTQAPVPGGTDLVIECVDGDGGLTEITWMTSGGDPVSVELSEADCGACGQCVASTIEGCVNDPVAGVQKAFWNILEDGSVTGPHIAVDTLPGFYVGGCC